MLIGGGRAAIQYESSCSVLTEALEKIICKRVQVVDRAACKKGGEANDASIRGGACEASN